MSGLMLNEDNSHFFATRSEEEMTVEGLKAMVDNYATEQMREIMVCPNATRVNFKPDIPFREPIWDGYDPDRPNSQPFFKGSENVDSVSRPRRWVHNAWLLNQKGIAPYEIC